MDTLTGVKNYYQIQTLHIPTSASDGQQEQVLEGRAIVDVLSTGSADVRGGRVLTVLTVRSEVPADYLERFDI